MKLDIVKNFTKLSIVRTVIDKTAPIVKPIVFTAKKHAPEILVVTGSVSIVGGTVYACKATVDAKEKLEMELSEIVQVSSEYDEEGNEIDRVVTVPESLSEIERTTAIQIGGRLLKGYLPAIGMVGGGIAMLVAAKSIEHRRFTAMLGAYSLLQSTFEEYRGRVIAEQGPEMDYRCMNGVEVEKVDILEEQEDGKKPKKVKEEAVVFTAGENPYHRIFDDCNSPLNWTNNMEQNRFFLECQQKAANMDLKRDGRLFLNDVYKRLGFDYLSIGQMVGWLADDIEGSKDGYVDFGIDYAALKEEIARAQAEQRRPEPSIWLTFNCDGVIWDKPLVKRYDA